MAVAAMPDMDDNGEIRAEIRAEIQGLKGEMSTLFAQLTGQLQTISAILNERQAVQQQLVGDVNILFDRQRQFESRLSAINHERMDTRITAIENKQGKHGERVAQAVMAAGLGGILLAAMASAVATRLLGQKTGHLLPPPAIERRALIA